MRFAWFLLLASCTSVSLRNGMGYEIRDTDRQSASVGVGVGLSTNTRLSCDARLRTPEELGIFCGSEITLWKK
jgi:hypothetical protein